MKIVNLKTYVVDPHGFGGRNWLFVKLKTDDGIEGIGEAFEIPFNPHVAARLIESTGERFVIDADPFKIESMWRKIYTSGYDGHPDMTKVAVISAFEIACWDIIGKATGQPVCNLLGGRYHEKIRTYTYMYPDPSKPRRGYMMGEPQEFGERAAYYLKEGFTAMKFDPVGLGTSQAPFQLSPRTLAQAEAITKSVREAVGDRCDIIIGTHGQMTTSSAIRLAKRLEKYDPLWFEEPVPPENKNEMARVAHATTIPIASGERLSTKYEFRELLEKQAANIVQTAVARVGGILEAKKIAAMAETYYAQIAPHVYSGPVEAMASIHVAACCPNFLITEGLEKWGGFYNEILAEPFQWEDGFIIPPNKPGLGIELKEEVMLKNVYQGTSPAIDLSYNSIYQDFPN
jgi:2-dehydro-3-deoxyphosphogalactonate aldolase